MKALAWLRGPALSPADTPRLLAAQLALLHKLGCDEAQGFLLGRPMPAADLAARLTMAPRPAVHAT